MDPIRRVAARLGTENQGLAGFKFQPYFKQKLKQARALFDRLEELIAQNPQQSKTVVS